MEASKNRIQRPDGVFCGIAHPRRGARVRSPIGLKPTWDSCRVAQRKDRGRLVETVASGVAELIPDPDRRAAFSLMLDGAPQSYVDLDEPTHLEFEYIRRMAAAID